MPKVLIVKLLLLVIIGAGLGAIVQTMLSPGKAPEIVFRQSGWSLLSDDERKVLQPLADKWGTMSSTQQEKWRAIAKNYPSLSTREQQKVHRRMIRWSGVAPEQRAVARKKYKTYKKKKVEEQERVRSAWQSHQKAKGQDETIPLPNGNEPPPNDSSAAKEAATAQPIPQTDSDPPPQVQRTENQE